MKMLINETGAIKQLSINNPDGMDCTEEYLRKAGVFNKIIKYDKNAKVYRIDLKQYKLMENFLDNNEFADNRILKYFRKFPEYSAKIQKIIDEEKMHDPDNCDLWYTKKLSAIHRINKELKLIL